VAQLQDEVGAVKVIAKYGELDAAERVAAVDLVFSRIREARHDPPLPEVSSASQVWLERMKIVAVDPEISKKSRDEMVDASLNALPPRLDSPLLFPALRGGHLNLHNWRRDDWNPALIAAGLSRSDANGKLHATRTPYAMRHFFISEAIAAGIPSYEVARLAGTSVVQIEATYAHLFGEHLERSRSALEAFDATNSGAYGQGLDTGG
jgi:integrase